MSSTQLMALDVETGGVKPEYGLQPWRAKTGEAWLTSIAIAYWANVVPQDQTPQRRHYRQPTPGQIEAVLAYAVNTNRYVVAWNAPFDIAWLIALGHEDLVLRVKWLDGLLLRKHLHNGPRFVGDGEVVEQDFGLKDVVAQEFPERAGYDDGITFDPQTEEEWVKLCAYNEDDAVNTLELTERHLERLTPEQLRSVMIESLSLVMVAKANLEGIHLNPKAFEALDAKLLQDARTAFTHLRMTSDITPETLASSSQLRDMLYRQWQLPVLSYTKPSVTFPRGQPSTDKDALSLLAVHDPRAALIHNYREATNNRTKFAVGALKSIEYNGALITHPIAKMFGTYTGRMTYSSKQGRGKSELFTGIPLHQWKRDPLYRGGIEAPEGYDLIEFDFAGQEFRWMAVQSGDPTMLSLCQPGEDAHAFMGAKTARLSYAELRRMLAEHVEGAKGKRQMGKVANLSLQYRTSASTLRRVARTDHNLIMTEQEARAVHGTYLTTYVEVPKYWQRQIYLGRKQGYVETLAGRRINLGLGDTWPNDYVWSYESTTINAPIQGTGADQRYLALAILKDYLPTVNGRFYFDLHDGLFLLVPKQYSQRAVHEGRQMLSNLPYKRAWGVDLPILFPVDAKIGQTWGGLVEVGA